MLDLIKEAIPTQEHWVRVRSSISFFSPLINFVFRQHSLPLGELMAMNRATNAVFRADSVIIKIFPPTEVDFESERDFRTELHGLSFANSQGVACPKLLASGTVSCAQDFRYIVMEFLEARVFSPNLPFTREEKIAIGRQFRSITDALNVPCDDFNSVEIIQRAQSNPWWKRFSEEFQNELHSFLTDIKLSNEVFVHGDLWANNVLIDEKNRLFIIDFADACHAPLFYEHVLVACDLFAIDGYFILGYFGDYDLAEMVEQMFVGLLIHDSGGEVVLERMGSVQEITSLAVLKQKVYDRFYESKKLGSS
jgi:hypothetical protein